MTCIQCQTEWCYVCGLSDKDCDRGGNKVNMYDHYIDWETNPNRCPIWLNEVYKVDKRWPNDENDIDGTRAVLFFSKFNRKTSIKGCIY